MASRAIQRVTMFKVPEASNIQPILDQYAKLQKEAKKDGKPYILRCVATSGIEDPRSQGYSICAQTTFASLEDMKYYDEQCEAHAALKGVAKGKVAAPPLCFYGESSADV